MGQFNKITNHSKHALIASSADQIRKNFYELVKELQEEEDKESLTIINFTRPSTKEKEEMEKQGFDVKRIFYIDGVTVHADFLPKEEGMFFLLNPEDLDGIIVGAKNALSKKEKMKTIVIDALDILQYYNSVEKIEEMIKELKLESQKNDFTIMAFINKENQNLTEKILPYFDEKIEL